MNGSDWLKSTVVLQNEVFGFDLPIVDMYDDSEDATVEALTELCEYMKDNVFAAGVELAEMTGEFAWKHWAKNKAWVHRDQLVEEAVDVLHFIANVMTGMGVTDEVFWAAYSAKQQTNRDRQAQAGGYDTSKKEVGTYIP